MRTAKQIRQAFQRELAAAIKRPGMYGAEDYFLGRVRDLAFVDRTERKLQSRLDELEQHRLFTSVGVTGWFQHRLPAITYFHNEVASVYARLAMLLGWVRPTRILNRRDFAEAKRLAHTLSRADCTSLKIVDAIGDPSFVIGDIHAYVGTDTRAGWIYFDYSFDPPGGTHFARTDAPRTAWRLRNSRVPTSHWFSERIRFTPSGRREAGR